MNDHRGRQGRWWVPVAVPLLGAGMLMMAITTTRGASVPDDGPPALEGPAAKGELLPDGAAVLPNNGPKHEALLAASGATPDRVRALKSPPPPIVERPADDRPNDQAQWVAGYWAWVPSTNEFAWVAGVWIVPTSDAIWVNGRWQRDADGWSRVPGFWSPRRGRPGDLPAPAVDWRTTGPPASLPADEPGKAPDPNAFYIPGHYAPEGDRVVWKPGFWARSQPGWEWLPARWVRRPTGWDYREGTWVRDTDAATRHTVARPAANGPALPPAIVESEPATTASAPAADPIASAEDAARSHDAQAQASTTVIVPRVAPYGYAYPNPYASPYGYPGPYGYYGPLSPRPYVPFGLMPPFARRILNRVLP